jgi:acetoin utilization deacetylase AcuC-like enzyme
VNTALAPVFTSLACLEHNPGPGHPESTLRLPAILARLREEPGARIINAASADRASLRRVHPQVHLDFLESVSRQGGGQVESDTVLNGHSWAAVLGATGAVGEGLQHVMGTGEHAFLAIRPPGHHASAGTAMGFCLVNNVVVAARAAQSQGHRLVLIIDWDVHHGNGTQDLVQEDATIRYVSLHQWPWYPGTGSTEERGVGNLFNVPRPPNLPPERYVEDLWEAVRAATTGWTPELVLISAGFDAMAHDPLGGFTLEPEHYAELTHRLRTHLPLVPILSMLEGGYAPHRVAEGVLAHVRALAS